MIDTQGNVFIGADNAQVDRYIEGAYVDAWRRCVKVMPRAWFGNASFINSQQYPDLVRGTGYVVLPQDFYLLTSFKMESWQKPVREAAIDNERTASIQNNEYTRGSEIRPVCTISLKYVDGQIKHVLNYYSLRKNLPFHKIEEAIYVPVVKPLKDVNMTDTLGLSEQVIEPLAYLLASSVFTLFEKYKIAKALEMRATEMFPGLQSVKGVAVTVKQ